MKLFCATSNPGKLREFRLLGADVAALPDLATIPAPEENGLTFEENAAEKAIYYSRFAPGLLFADDSGLVVDALGGEPGVHSARFAGSAATTAANNALLLSRLEGCGDRQARFVCVVALAADGKLLGTFRGEVAGEILTTPRGEGGFGYDPLFYYPPLGKGMAELNEEEKFLVSHRGHALRSMLAFLATFPAQQAQLRAQ